MSNFNHFASHSHVKLQNEDKDLQVTLSDLEIRHSSEIEQLKSDHDRLLLDRITVLEVF